MTPKMFFKKQYVTTVSAKKIKSYFSYFTFAGC